MSDRLDPEVTYEWRISGLGWGNNIIYDNEQSAIEDLKYLRSNGHYAIELNRREITEWKSVEVPEDDEGEEND